MQPPYTVVPGQVLCIPEGDKSASTTPASKKGAQPVLSGKSGLSQVLVSVENFPKKTSYYVRIYPANRPVSYRLGVFTTNKEGDFTDWFNIPNYVRRNLDDDPVRQEVSGRCSFLCEIPRIDLNFPFTKIEHSPKDGR